MQRNGLITLLTIFAILIASMATVTYAIETVEFEKLCFKGEAFRENINGTFKYSFNVHHCFFDYEVLESESGDLIYIKKEG